MILMAASKAIPIMRSGRTRRYGCSAAVHVAPAWNLLTGVAQSGSTDVLYQDGFRLPERNENQRWQFMGRKAFGRNLVSLSSISLSVDSEIPARMTESLRHTLRHTFRAGFTFQCHGTPCLLYRRGTRQRHAANGPHLPAVQQHYDVAADHGQAAAYHGARLVQDSESRGLMIDTQCARRSPSAALPTTSIRNT